MTDFWPMCLYVEISLDGLLQIIHADLHIISTAACSLFRVILTGPIVISTAFLGMHGLFISACYKYCVNAFLTTLSFQQSRVSDLAFRDQAFKCEARVI